MKPPQYSRMSFTSGGLCLPESIDMAALYLELQDWSKVRAHVLEHNLLRARTRKSAMTLSREVINRLQLLNLEELETLVQCPSRDQAYLLWISICRCYRFIGEFATEVLRERFLSLQATLAPHHVDQFFDRKADWHPELLLIRPSTREKLRQNLLKMLREAHLLSDQGLILPPLFSRDCLKLCHAQILKDLLYLPMFESDLKLAYKQ